ncbi:MAG TPA: M48 family metalloprotease [Rhizomicrobium sp.]
MRYCNPASVPQTAFDGARLLRRAVGIAVTAACTVCIGANQAVAQGIDIIRDTEIEHVLHSYEDPILKVAGLDPATVKIYVVNDPSINAFAAQSPAESESEDIFINAGLILQLKSPNQVTGVLAHETGHIAGGHILRGEDAMKKAMVPMLIGMIAGIAAAIAGGGEAGMGVMALGEQAAMANYLEFSRAQEATADQMGQKFLLATHQSGRGMLEVFERFAQEDAMSAYYQHSFASDHPADRERIDLLQREVDASPYRDVPDSPAAVHEFHMIQAKLSGYLSKPDTVLGHYPPSDTSEEARYARAMAYFRKPDLPKALSEINSLIKDEPRDPYFWEVLGQIYVDMSQPEKGVEPYQKSVDLMPNAPLLRIALAAAQLATEKPALAKPALDNLKAALLEEHDNEFAWYEAAQAYSDLGNEPMANLSTAELDFSVGNFGAAEHFAGLAQHRLAAGSPDWQRASDILSIAQGERRRR